MAKRPREEARERGQAAADGAGSRWRAGDPSFEEHDRDGIQRTEKSAITTGGGQFVAVRAQRVWADLPEIREVRQAVLVRRRECCGHHDSSICQRNPENGCTVGDRGMAVNQGRATGWNA